MSIDIERSEVRSATRTARFSLSARHRQMFLNGLDLIGASLVHANAITDFERRHWEHQPWLQSVAAVVRARVR